MSGRINVDAWLVISAFLLGMMSTSTTGRTISVDADASPSYAEYKQERDQLIKALGNGDRTVRMNAAKAISMMGPSAEPAIQPLINMLLEDNVNVNGFYAGRALGSIGPAALPAVMGLLEHEDRDVRMHAVTALGVMGPAAEPAIPALIEMLRGDLHWHAVSSLGSIGSPAVPGLTGALEDEDWRIRFYAVVALGEMGPAGKSAKPTLIRMLKDKNEIVRRCAAETTAKIDPHAIEEFIETIDDPHDDIRTHAMHALSNMGPTVIPILLKMFENKNHIVWNYAHTALRHIIVERPSAVSALMEALKHEEVNVRMEVAKVLIPLGHDLSMPGLIIALDDEDPSVRKVVCWAFCWMGGLLAEDAALSGLLPKLNRLAEDDEDAEVRDVARKARETILFEIKLKERLIKNPGLDDVPMLIEALRGSDKTVWEHTFDALIQVGPPAIPALGEALKYERLEYREGAVRVLAQIVPAGIPGLTTALGDEDPSIRTLACEVLGGVGTPAEEVLPKLNELAKVDKYLDVRNAAQGAVERISVKLRARQKLLQVLRQPPNNPGHIPVLIEGLGTGDDVAQRRAIEALVNIMGPSAIPALEEALKHKEINVRKGAVIALDYMGPAGISGLTMALYNQDYFIFEYTVRALGRKGRYAISILPILNELVKNTPYEGTRNLINESIRRIQRGTSINQGSPRTRQRYRR